MSLDVNMQQPSIIFIIPYFGRWPAWFDFYLQSCRFNPDIHWLFYTDCALPEQPPNNVKFVSLSFADYNHLVSERLQIDFQPDTPYKLCDIKPALGFIHEQAIQGYDFWGFSDIDLVYGNLRGYFNAERLSRYDLYSTHVRRVSGHLCLMRNTPTMRAIFKRVKGWQNALAARQHLAFDEKAFSRLFIKRKNFPKPLYTAFAKLNRWNRCSEFCEAYSTPNAGVAWIDGSYDFPRAWYWQQGRLTNNLTGSREYPYFHFLGWKNKVWDVNTDFPKLGNSPLAFQIDEAGFKVTSDE